MSSEEHAKQRQFDPAKSRFNRWCDPSQIVACDFVGIALGISRFKLESLLRVETMQFRQNSTILI